ncbi:hypothetical protein RJ55_04463 [Drechmeria coniospora]|nr:hypothetical protein RJ55_04463 [Drechmeria coniospora]
MCPYISDTSGASGAFWCPRRPLLPPVVSVTPVPSGAFWCPRRLAKLSSRHDYRPSPYSHDRSGQVFSSPEQTNPPWEEDSSRRFDHGGVHDAWSPPDALRYDPQDLQAGDKIMSRS